MADPVRFSRHFHSSEVPGWHLYPDDVARDVGQLVRAVLQPMRRRWGPIIITDGWRSSGAHSRGALDVVPVAALEEGHTLREVGDWGATHLSCCYGELIVEPVPWGGHVTGHLHVTPPGVGSPGTGEYLIRTGRDRFEFGRTRVDLLLLVVVVGAGLLLTF